MKQISVSAGILINNDNQILLSQRTADKSFPGQWEFPGGKIEAGESDLDAAVRECFEETGVTVAVVGRYMMVEHSYEHGDLQLSFIACEAKSTVSAIKQPFCWVHREQLAELSFPEANAVIVEQLRSRREIVQPSHG